MSRSRSVCVYALIFLAGGLAYCVMELIYRGRSHPSMFIAGGLSLVFLYIIAAKSRVPAWKKWIIGGAVITTIEFITGAVVNIALGLNVWDYSGMAMNFMGQISLSFSLLWVLLSIPSVWLLERLDNRLAKRRDRA